MEFKQMPGELIDKAEEELKKEYAQKKPVTTNEESSDTNEKEEILPPTLERPSIHEVMEIEPMQNQNIQNKNIFLGTTVAICLIGIILIAGVIIKHKD